MLYAFLYHKINSLMIDSTKKRVLLIDGNSFCYRAFYAIRNLSTSSGVPTNAVFGFISILNKLLSEHKPHYLAVSFDLKGPTFRHKRFVDYKLKRRPMPDELSAQMPVIKKVLSAYRIGIFEKEGYEADDILATLAKRLASCGLSPKGQAYPGELEILIATGDKDILQLVGRNIKVLNPQKDNLILDEAWVKKRYGVAPEQIVEIMALAGDASDNIPGVPGIGEATAIELIKRFGTLEVVLANVDKIENKVRRAKIKEFSEQARMSRELVVLDSNVPQMAQRGTADLLEHLKMKEADNEKLLELFKELEFKSLIRDLTPESKVTVECKIISHPDEAKEVIKKLQGLKNVAVHFWPSDYEPMRAEILGAAFSFEEGKSLFFSFSQIPPDVLKPVLENRNIKKSGHDLKYLKVLLSNHGIDLQGISFDTMLAAYLLEPDRARYRLADLALEYLNCKLPARPALSVAGGEARPLSSAGTEREAAEICCQNANTTLRLVNILQKLLRQKNLLDLFQNIELPLIDVLADMEKEGVSLDKDLLLHLSSNFEKRLKTLTSDIYEMTGESFNINSPKQLSVILFEKLKLPRIKRTKTGSSTDTEVLQRLGSMHPVANTLLEFRELSKLKSTYIDGLMKLLHPRTRKIHASFNQVGTATGRLACTRPNLQNIPVKTELGRGIRQAFIADKERHLLLSADYSQIELRILAHLSEDKNLISAFKEDLDIHRYTASLIFALPQEEVTTQMRDTAKTVNFGIIYGMTPFGLSKDLGIEQSRAQEFIEAYFLRYPGVKKYIERQIARAEKDGYVTTLLKRRRYVPQIKSRDEKLRQFAQRVVMNAPVQGSASDLIKAAMLEIYRALKSEKLSTRMLLQVHDELVFIIPQEELACVPTLIKEKMENVLKLKVPLKVSIKTGKNWLELK